MRWLVRRFDIVRMCFTRRCIFGDAGPHRPCRVGASARSTPAEWCCEWVVRTCSAVCNVPRRHAKATVNNVSIHYLHPAQYTSALCHGGVHPRVESIRTLYAPSFPSIPFLFTPPFILLAAFKVPLMYFPCIYARKKRCKILYYNMLRSISELKFFSFLPFSSSIHLNYFYNLDSTFFFIAEHMILTKRFNE